MKVTVLFAALFLSGATLASNELDEMWSREKDFKFNELFPRRPFSGQRAAVQGWSFDDRYLAYLWNPYGVRGRDLYLFDSETGKSTQVTSIEMMAKYDLDAKKAIGYYKEEDKRLDEWDKLSDAEWRKAKLKFAEEQSKRKEPNPSYGGPSSITWAHKSNEFLMTFRGDIWRWKVGQSMPMRLTQTRDQETNVEYLPDDSGYTFQRGDGVYRMVFGNDFVRQLNPKLPAGVNFNGYAISPNGKQMLVYGSKPDPGNVRQVDWIQYRDRFARALKTSRGVSEDDFPSTQFLYLADIRESTLDQVDPEPKPLEVYKYDGGEDYWELSINEHPWSPDGSTFAFASWKRDAKELIVWEADVVRGKSRKVYVGTSNGEHRTPSLTSPLYSPDGSEILCLMDKSGWRQVHALERVWGKERQVTSGEFETYPLALSADKRTLLVSSTKNSLARDGYFRVDLKTGVMNELSSQVGTYSSPAFGHKSDKMASIFNSWSAMPELFFIEGGKEKKLTESNREKDFFNVVKGTPELFNYKNRHGQTIHGYRFMPENLNDGKEHPLFIYVYGGPLGTSKSVEDGAFNSTAYLFLKYLTHHLGYITATIDPRGQSGYSAEFGRANWENPGAAQNEDLVDFVKSMKSQYPVDSSKVGITGWSFGGFQTQYCLYNSPDVFTLGIAGAGPTEWQNYNTWYTGGVIGNSPKGDGNYLDKYSLTKVAENLKSPLLLLHGIEDTNVLFQDTVHVYRKLLQAGKGPLVELCLDPTGGHGMGGDVDTRDRHMIYLSFILRHWGFPQ